MLLDTSALYFRAFHGVPDRFHAPDGTPVNAVRGLVDIVARLATQHAPGRIVACWDDDWRPQWRVDLIPSYKAHRVVAEVTGAPDVEEVPDPLETQVPVIREALGLLGIAVVGAPGYEADDVIGTLAARNEHVDIVTSDRDLFQLVDDARDVRVISTSRGMSNLEIVTEEQLMTRYGVGGRQYADFATLRGDASDGLPGVKGVGEKTAATLLRAHGTLAGIRTAAAAGEGMSAAVARRILDAAPYLDVAPRVVAVARDLDLPLLPGTRGVPDAAAAGAFAARWSLESPMQRALGALSS